MLNVGITWSTHSNNTVAIHMIYKTLASEMIRIDNGHCNAEYRVERQYNENTLATKTTKILMLV